MFGNFSMPELLIVGALALIVIGPRDLPGMMRSVGKFVGQARGMARQFQRSMDDAAREVDLAEFKEAKAMLDKKANTKGLTDTLSDTIGLDEDDKPPKKPTMTAAEMAEASKHFSDEPRMEPDQPSPTPEPDVANVAEPEPAKVSQG